MRTACLVLFLSGFASAQDFSWEDAANLHMPVYQSLASDELEAVDADVPAKAERVDGIETGSKCPGAAKYGYDKIKFLGGCLQSSKASDIPPMSEFKITYHWTQIEDGIVCKFSLISKKHGFTLEVDNNGEINPQEGIPEDEDKYKMLTCANHIDEMDHHPWQGSMGLKEMDSQELAEFNGFRQELGEVDTPTATIEDLSSSIPTEFDARKKWPQCKWLNSPGNQRSCGSCWAYAASLAYSTRLCTMTNGTHNIDLSPQDMNSCTRTNGCRGGWPHCGFLYMSNSGGICYGAAGKREGLVDMKCDPYTAKDHSTGDKCGTHCKSPPAVSYMTNRSTIKWVKAKDEKAMQKEIMEKGAIVNCFDVYNDFSGRGVYTKGKSAKKRGAHAVVTIGWGVDKGVKYWLAENSWGNRWGEKGYFRIKRGVDEARYESWPYCYGGVVADPVIPKSKSIKCLNGGTPSSDGKSCVCPVTATGKTCETCVACKNGGTSDSKTCKCACKAASKGMVAVGALCQAKFLLSCSGSAAKLSFTPSSVKDKSLRRAMTGDYAVLLNGAGPSACAASAKALAKVGGVGGEGPYKKYACGKFKKNTFCPANTFSSVFGKVNATASWTACFIPYMGVNEFGQDKGYAASGTYVGSCKLSAPSTSAPTQQPTQAPVAPKTAAPVSPATAAPTKTKAPPSPSGSIDCTVTGKPYAAALKAGKEVALHCSSACTYNVDQADQGWGVWGLGPFRIDSAICRAAFVAGVIGHSGGSVTMTSSGEEPEFVSFGVLMRQAFCFKNMPRKCKFELAKPYEHKK